MDDIALNYNSDATADDGSCQYVEGCMDDDALNYNPDATQGMVHVNTLRMYGSIICKL